MQLYTCNVMYVQHVQNEPYTTAILGKHENNSSVVIIFITALIGTLVYGSGTLVYGSNVL